MSINYNEEYEKLGGGDWFKPKQGSYKITILEEPTPDQYVDKEGNVTEQIRLAIRVTRKGDSKDYSWNVSKGTTRKSLWGQLMVLGRAHQGLKGVGFNLLVNSDGEKNSYTVPEALDLMPDEETV